MLSGKRNKYKLSNANTAFIHQKHLKSFAPHHRKKRKKRFERKKKFSKSIKGGVGIKISRVKKFQKINNWGVGGGGGRLFGT